MAAELKGDNIEVTMEQILAGITVLIVIRWRINVLTLGDKEAKTLGINPGKTRFIIIAAATIITAPAVMVAGIVG